jgi:dolichol-phosphate mannosyltransferase
MSSRTLIILPTYNERESLEHTVIGVLEHAPESSILIVDDNSPDGTGAIADRLAEQHGNVTVLHRMRKEGLGPAYIAGFKYGFEQRFDLLVEMDADGSHRPEDLPQLLAAAEFADLVIGSRWVAGGAVVNWPWHRELISRLGNNYARIMLGSKVRDLTAGFRVYRASLLEKIIDEDVASHGYSFQVELAWRSERAGSIVIECPITFVEREQGSSKMSSAIVREALWLISKWGFRRMFSRG